MSQPPQSKPRYRTTNLKHYNAALKARGSLTVWLDKGMSWFAAASCKRGRSPQFSDTAIQFFLTTKNLFGLTLRQTTGFVQSLLALSGLAWPVLDFSTLCRRQRNLDVQLAYRAGSAGLHLLVHSTGIKFLGEGEWKCQKHGPERRRQWRKLHIGIDAQTLQVRAICVTTNNVSDAAVMPALLAQVPAQELLLTVIGNGAYDTQPVHAAVMHRNASIAGCRSFGRKLWKSWSVYHRRSLVETKMNCVKRLGERVMSRTFERQVNELHI
jgi:hypothetical protein